MSSSKDLPRRILTAALQHVPQQSFSRQAVRAGLVDVLPNLSTSPLSLTSGDDAAAPPTSLEMSQLRAIESSKQESMLESLFGVGLGPERALVNLWSAHGIEKMQEEMSSDGDEHAKRLEGTPKIREALAWRLKYTSETAGEHAVQVRAIETWPRDPPSLRFPLRWQAYALLASADAHALTMPKIPSSLQPMFESIKNSLRPLPAYDPASAFAPAATRASSSTSSQSTADSHSILARSSIPLPGVHILPLLSYGFRIADAATYMAANNVSKGRVEGGGVSDLELLQAFPQDPGVLMLTFFSPALLTVGLVSSSTCVSDGLPPCRRVTSSPIAPMSS